MWQFLPDLVPMKAGTKLFFTVPSQIAGTLWQMFATGSIWAPLGVSAGAFAVGLALAIVAGLPLGILLGRSNTLNAMFDPFITAFNATPRLVFLPLLMLWFGIGLWSKVAIVFLGALFPLLINTYEGVRNADKLLINVVRSFGAGEWDIARLVVVPNALPFIVVGLAARHRPRRARRRGGRIFRRAGRPRRGHGPRRERVQGRRRVRRPDRVRRRCRWS